MTARARNGRFTAERTTETVTTETTITERITVEETDTIAAFDDEYELSWAQGWDPGPILPRHDWLAQRAGQRDQALGLLALWDASAPPGEPVPGWLIRQAVTILRAGPGATPMELTLGRSI